MSRKKLLVRATLCVASALLPIIAHADQYSDDLARCLVTNTSAQDKGVFVKWIFAVMALHPDVAAMANISDSQRDALNKQTGDLFTRLLTENCKQQAQQAILFDGTTAISSAFEVLGRSATMSLMTDDKVTAGMKDFSKYMDAQKIMKVLGNSQPSAANPPTH